MTAGETTGLARRAAGVAATRMVLIVLGAVASVIIARALGPAGRGEYAVVIALAGTAVSLGHASVEHAQVFMTSRGRRARALASNALVLGLGLGLLAIICLTVVLAFGWPEQGLLTQPAMLLAMAAVPLGIVVLYTNGLLVLEGRIGHLNVASLLAGVVQAVALVALALTDRLTVTTVVAVWVLNAALPLAVSLPSLQPRRADLSWPVARHQLAVGLRYHVGMASLYLLLRVDILILAALVSDRDVGLYSLAVTLIELTHVATDAVATVVVRRQASLSLDDAADLTAHVVGVTVLLGAVAVTGLFVTAPLLVPLVYGADFRGAVPALGALAPGVLALAAMRPAGSYLVRLDRPWLVSALATTALAINVVTNLVLIPLWGIVGAGLASSVAYISIAVAYLVWLQRSTRLPLAAFAPRVPWRNG